MRLNGWQRIGIVLSVLWFLVGGFSGTIAQELPSQAPQGTEFWPPLFGYRLKVTDTLLVTVTFLLFADQETGSRCSQSASPLQSA
jgi:hypothetical protein